MSFWDDIFSQANMKDYASQASSGAAGRDDGIVQHGTGSHSQRGYSAGTPTHDPLKELLALAGQQGGGRRNLPADFMSLTGYSLLDGPPAPIQGLLGGNAIPQRQVQQAPSFRPSNNDYYGLIQRLLLGGDL